MGYILPFSFAQDTDTFKMKSFIFLTACLAAASAEPHYVHHGVGAYPYVSGAYPYALGAPITYSAHAPVVAPVTYSAPTPVAAPVTYSVPAPVVAPVTYTAQAPVAPVHEYTLPVAPVFDGKAPEPVQDNPDVAAAKAAHIAKVEGNVLPAEHVFAAEELPVAPVHVYSLPVAPVYDGKAPEPVQDEPEVAAAKAAHIALVESNTLPETPIVYELPVAPVYDGVAPEPIQDTPEVVAARAEHLAAVEAALAGQTYAPTFTHTVAPTEIKVVEAPVAPVVTYTTTPIAAPVAPLATRLPYAGFSGYHYAAAPAYTGYTGYPASYGYATGYGAYPATYAPYHTPYIG